MNKDYQTRMFGFEVSEEYHDTVRLSKPERERRSEEARRQTELIEVLFMKHKRLSPSQVWQKLMEQGSSILLTSVRRSITNLTNAKVLKKCVDEKGKEVKVMGMYGSPEGVWEYRV